MPFTMSLNIRICELHALFLRELLNQKKKKKLTRIQGLHVTLDDN